MPRIQIKEVDIPGLVEQFPIIPYASRLYVVEKEIEKVGLIYITKNSRDNEMQTNEGWVVAVGNDVEFCEPGDVVFYGRYSGAWTTLGEQRFRVMNEEDILGKQDPFKEELWQTNNS
jgi:co-chaperonin GroES (HSP10)